jgi:broad specificity phosphatase PhoE
MTVHLTYCTHSVTLDNEAGIATGWLPGRLSPTGRRLAVDLGRVFASTPWDAVYCSDLARAVQTAEIAFGANHDICPDARLRECDYGDLNGARASAIHAQAAARIDEPFPGGECYRDVEARMASFVADRRLDSAGQHVLVVSHHAPQVALDVLLTGVTWEYALAHDWRTTGRWRPGWEYELT